VIPHHLMGVGGNGKGGAGGGLNHPFAPFHQLGMQRILIHRVIHPLRVRCGPPGGIHL
tara:strand:- start:102833 stop:103006 length:174 start_codon:yes stop_codon:yes gene_type:complete